MPVTGPIPAELLTVVAAAAVFTVMFTIGVGVVLREVGWVFAQPGLVTRALFSVLIAMPVATLAVVRMFDLPRLAEIGIVLMSISPGAPVALRRSLGVGGHRAFAPALQILVAILAVVSMPISIAALDELYAGDASISPAHLARQVLTAQLLPLGLGIAIRSRLPALADWLQPRIARAGSVLLLALVVLALIDVWQVVVEAGPRTAVAIALVTALALAIGHLLGGPDPRTRTAVAISSAARNPGLALLVAALNNAAPEVERTVLAYLVVSAITVVPYVAWRRRSGGALSRQ